MNIVNVNSESYASFVKLKIEADKTSAHYRTRQKFDSRTECVKKEIYHCINKNFSPLEVTVPESFVFFSRYIAHNIEFWPKRPFLTWLTTRFYWTLEGSFCKVMLVEGGLASGSIIISSRQQTMRYIFLM